MNRLNATRSGFEVSGPALKFRAPDGRLSAFEKWPGAETDSDQFTVGSAGAADPRSRKFVDLDPATDLAADAMDVCRRLSEQAIAIRADAKLSAAGKAEQIGAAGTKALAEVHKADTALSEMGARLQAQRAALYAVPAPPAASSGTTVLDLEMRVKFRSLSPVERERMLGTLDRPDMVPMLHALLRGSPLLDEPTNQRVQAAWEKRVAAEKPAEERQLREQIASHEWSQRFTRYLAVKFAQSTWPTSDVRTFDHSAAYSALRPLGATSMLPLDAHSVAMLERMAVAREAAAAAEAARKRA